MERPFRIEGAALVYGALAIILLPMTWFLGILTAMTIHELCHYLAARALGIPVHGFSLGISGARIRLGPMGKWEEILVSAAGPAGNLFLLTFLRIFPELAICSLIQGLYNLLPVYPMDGGRILNCLAGERITRSVSRMTGLLLLFLGFLGAQSLNAGWLFSALWCSYVVKSCDFKNFLQRRSTRGTIELPIFKR